MPDADERAGERPRKRSVRGETTASDLTPDKKQVAETWDRLPERGGVSANDTAKPRDTEAVDAEEDVVVGFTNTSPTGSAGGRALYGAQPRSEREIEEEE